MAIIAAINSAPIARLRRTRELIKGKSTYKKFHNLEVLMSTDKSFGNYRLALKVPSRGHDEQFGIPYLCVSFLIISRMIFSKFLNCFTDHQLIIPFLFFFE
jgi:hypothetical protein